ncbi:MAG TPA: hypothetical protein VKB58_12815 [Terriglobales bacterium]|nr:hypothetical protein [Terriglobales bacterium]
MEREEQQRGHPEQYSTAYASYARGLRLHLLAAGPQLARGGRRQSCRRAIIVDRCLCVQRKKEHQGAKPYAKRAPKILVLHDAKIHGKRQSHPDNYYTYESGIRNHPSRLFRDRDDFGIAHNRTAPPSPRFSCYPALQAQDL